LHECDAGACSRRPPLGGDRLDAFRVEGGRLHDFLCSWEHVAPNKTNASLGEQLAQTGGLSADQSDALAWLAVLAVLSLRGRASVLPPQEIVGETLDLTAIGWRGREDTLQKSGLLD
jgi:hypothetical protein